MCEYCVEIMWGRLDPFHGDGKKPNFVWGPFPVHPCAPMQYFCVGMCGAMCESVRQFLSILLLFYYDFEPFYCILLCCTQKKANCLGEEKDSNLKHVWQFPQELGSKSSKISSVILPFVYCTEVSGTTKKAFR